MSRGTARAARPVAVWSAVTAVALAAAAAAPGAWQAAAAAERAGRPGAEVDVLVAACATGLAVSLTWLWAITTATVAGVLVGSGRSATPRGTTRRLVLLACGVAVVAGSGTPALASGGDADGATLLAGLPIPERAVAPAADAARNREARPVARPAPAAAQTYVVRPGDSLWSIAESHPEPRATGTGSVEERWQAIWQANRDVVGDDPDLILPGQALRLPGPHHPDRLQPRAPKDGDR